MELQDSGVSWSTIILIGQLSWGYEVNNSLVRVHGGSRMDNFKMACISSKMRFVRYVMNMCTVWLCYELSCIKR